MWKNWNNPTLKGKIVWMKITWQEEMKSDVNERNLILLSIPIKVLVNPELYKTIKVENEINIHTYSKM